MLGIAPMDEGEAELVATEVVTGRFELMEATTLGRNVEALVMEATMLVCRPRLEDVEVASDCEVVVVVTKVPAVAVLRAAV